MKIKIKIRFYLAVVLGWFSSIVDRTAFRHFFQKNDSDITKNITKSNKWDTR